MPASPMHTDLQHITAGLTAEQIAAAAADCGVVVTYRARHWPDLVKSGKMTEAESKRRQEAMGIAASLLTTVASMMRVDAHDAAKKATDSADLRGKGSPA